MEAPRRPLGYGVPVWAAGRGGVKGKKKEIEEGNQRGQKNGGVFR